MGLPGEIRITQLPALPSNDTFYRPGYASPAGRHEKVPAALAGRGTDIRSHLCRGIHCIFAYLETGSRMPVPTSICTSYDLILRREAETSTRENKTGEKDFNPTLH
jgi:hypothetical protein